MCMFCTTCAVSTAARTGGQEILMIGFTKPWHIWVHSVQPNDTVMLFTSMLIHQRVPPECSWESWQMESKTIPSPTMRFAETWAWFDSRSRKHPHTSQRVKGWNNHFIYGTLRFAAKLFTETSVWIKCPIKLHSLYPKRLMAFMLSFSSSSFPLLWLCTQQIFRYPLAGYYTVQ